MLDEYADAYRRRWWTQEYRDGSGVWWFVDHVLLSEIEVAGIEFMTGNLRFL